jgi:ABC-type transport system substrate-binding protein
VRKAIAHAIDRQGIIDGLMAGYDKPAATMLSPVHVGYVEGFKGYAYDPAKAKALLKEAGITDKPFTLFTAPTFDQRIVQAIQQMLIDVGLKVTITTSDFAGWLKRAQSSPAEFGEMTSAAVLRLPGCRWRPVPALPLLEPMGEVRDGDGPGAGGGAFPARFGADPLQARERNRRRNGALVPLPGRDPLWRAQGAALDADAEREPSSTA